jgi:sugar phosphate isomerase/epimerase
MNQLNRREFVGSLVSGLAVSGLCCPVARGALRNDTSLKLGYSLYGMRQVPLDEALQHCARIGYQAVELALMPGWPCEPAVLQVDDRVRIRKRIAELKLELPALMENLPINGDDATHRAQLERLKASCQLAHDLKGERPPIIETILGGKDGEWMQLRDLFVRRLGDWDRIARESQTVICIKPHRMGAMNRPEQANWLLEQLNSPWLKLVYDYSHFQHRDMTIADTVRALRASIQFVHVKDTIIEAGKAKFVLPGDGGIDYTELFGQLRAANFTGCICVEVSGMVQNQPNYDPVAAAERSYRTLVGSL